VFPRAQLDCFLDQQAADLARSLRDPRDQQQIGRAQQLALTFVQFGPDDQVRQSGLVFQRDEQMPLGRRRCLADDHQPGDLDALNWR
jgi:hypothetical protein